MVLTDRQRADLHAGIYEYLASRSGDAFQRAAAALAEADPDSCAKVNASNNGTDNNNNKKSTTPILEKKWTAIPRLQKKVMELERQAAQSAKIHAHRGIMSTSTDGGGPQRRMLPRLPSQHTLQGHSMVVTSVALHPVFTVVASGSEDGTVKIWDHESGDYIRTLKGHTNSVTSIAFTPRGTHLASSSTDLSIKLWDVSSYACLRTLRGHDHTISCVSFLPLMEFATATTTTISENSTTAGASTTTTTTTTTGVVAALAGCQHLLSASRDHTVKMWDVETGFCDHTFNEHTDWVRALAVRQSDGGLWASAGNDQSIFVYDPATKRKVVELRGHEHVIESLAFVTEEPFKQQQQRGNTRETTRHTETVRDYLASGSRDRTVRLWRISEASCVCVFRAHENWVQSVLIHPNGNYVLSCGDDKSIRVFDIKAQRCLRTLENAHNHFVTSLNMHHTLPILVSGSVDQTVRCWQLD